MFAILFYGLEGTMKLRNLLGSALLTALMVGPLSVRLVQAQNYSRTDVKAYRMRDDDDDKHRQAKTRRYYDKRNKDYHEWNDNEARYYGQWQQQNHNNRDFNKLNRKQQEEYWQWRHQHGDNDHDRDDRR
jgi:hypothetical protein